MTEGLDTGRIFVTGFVICILSGCTVFQSRVNDETRVLRTVPFDPIWDLDLYELHAIGIKDSTPPVDLFLDSGRYYSFKDRVVWSMVEYHLDSLRIRSIPKVDAWYRTERPRISDSLHTKYIGEYHRFEGELHFTGDTAWKWLGDMDTFETCERSMTLSQLLKPDHWYLFVFDSEGPTHSLGRGHYLERRVSFFLDANRQVQSWQSVRHRKKKMRIV